MTVIISINETNSSLPFVVDLAFTKLLCSTSLCALLNLVRDCCFEWVLCRVVAICLLISFEKQYNYVSSFYLIKKERNRQTICSEFLNFVNSFRFSFQFSFELTKKKGEGIFNFDGKMHSRSKINWLLFSKV